MTQTNLDLAAKIFGPPCEELDDVHRYCNGAVSVYPKTGGASARLEVDGKKSALFGSLDWFEKRIKKNGGGDPRTALEKFVREESKEAEREAQAEEAKNEREAEAEEAKHEAAGIVNDILIEKLRPKQDESGKWRLDLGLAEIEVEPDDSTKTLAYRAIDEFEAWGIRLPKVGRKFTEEERARVRASLPKPEGEPPAADPVEDLPSEEAPQPDHPAPNTEAESIKFLQKLRPGGPSLLTAIVPDGATTTITAQTADQVEAFVRKHDGKQNLYYSVNPTRKRLNKKAAKTDIAAIEYMLADLDPNEGETSEAAKARYLKALESFEPKPTAAIDSGNGIQALWRLQERIVLGEPIWVEKQVTENGKTKTKKVLEFSAEDQAKIADVEARAATLMLRLGAKPGTQNVDRILRLPGTINLPNEKKRKQGRTQCPTKLLWFNDASYPLDAFLSNNAPLTGFTLLSDDSGAPRLSLPFVDLGTGLPKPRDETASGYGFRFMRDCHAKGVTYGEARTAILADKTKAGEWANRIDERQLQRAWEHSKPNPKPGGGGNTTVDAEIAQLATLSTFEYERKREIVAEKLSIRVTTLDKLVAKRQAPALQLGSGGLQDDLALKFSTTYASDLRYVAAWNKWFQWDGVRWREEKTLHAFHLARDICRKADQQAADHMMVAGVIGLARTDRRQAAITEQWDADPWLLGTPEGTIDLRTGKLSPPKPADYITKITAVAPSNEPPRDSCPLWLAFLNRVMNGDEGLQDYLQRVCGYSLTGNTTEDALFFHYGTGDNGKSVFSDTISGILNDYHETADMELFVITHGEKHPTDLASLRGARLVTAVETEEGKRWAEAKLKKMTGGNPIKARFMKQDFFTYSPQFKLSFEGNHKPTIRNVDRAISRRMNLIPWLVTIPVEERDKDLSDKLKAEWPGILRWMIDGCLAWQREGLKPPKIVRNTTKDYLESQDTTQNFFDDCCIIANNESDSFEHIWDGFVDWAEDCREYISTKKAFGQKLIDKGFQSKPYGPNRVVTYFGIRCIRENKKKLMDEARRRTEEERHRPAPAENALRPIVVGKAPEGVPCVHCGSIGDRPVLKLRDNRVPPGEPGGRAECLHWPCAQKWFKGEFPPQE
jgi:putative DNA primase/helicase